MRRAELRQELLGDGAGGVQDFSERPSRRISDISSASQGSRHRLFMTEDHSYTSMRDLEGESVGEDSEDEIVQVGKNREKNPDVYERLESLDVDQVNHPYHVDSQRKLSKKAKAKTSFVSTSTTIYLWVLTILIGVGVAVAARGVQFSIYYLREYRNSQLQRFFDSDSSMVQAFVFFATWNMTFVLVAAFLCVFVEPMTAADGLAEIKAFINGVHVRRFLKLRTIVLKIVGTIFACASGLVIGAEAPLIHIGAGIASGVTRGDKLKNLCFEFSPTLLGRFHNDRDRRDFISAGAGAGMAAAFGAPIGGVLFVLEETAAAWSPALTWRIFTAALVASVALALLKAEDNRGDISASGLLSFGTSESIKSLRAGFTGAASALEAPIYSFEPVFYAVVGVLGGTMGGIFNRSMCVLQRWRPRRRALRTLEAVVVSLLTSGLIFYLSFYHPSCRENGYWTCRDAYNWGEWCSGRADNTTCQGGARYAHASCANESVWMCVGGVEDGKSCLDGNCSVLGGECRPVRTLSLDPGIRLGCDEGEYSELATMLLGSREQAFMRMVDQAWPVSPFSTTSLLLAVVSLFFLLTITFGAPIPGGFLMPCIFIGGCVGRIIGDLVKQYIDARVFPGNYALAGAAALAGGVQRSTISLVFILIEGTGNVHGLLSVVISTVVANFVGNFFGKEGIYDVLVRRKRLRFLPHEPDFLMDLTTVGDVMARPVVCFRIVERVGSIVDVLRGCEHNGFPIVSVGGGAGQSSLPDRSLSEFSPGGRLEGVILRSHLRHLLAARFLQDGGKGQPLWQCVTGARPGLVPLDGDPRLYAQMETRRRTGSHVCHSIKEWEWALFSKEDRGRYVNLGAYMNASCLAVAEDTPLSKAFALFQHMSLRHLPVTDIHHRVVGILGRDNLTKELLHKTISAYYRPDDIHSQPAEPHPPRLRAGLHLQQRQRRPGLPVRGSELGGGSVHRAVPLYTGGPTQSWQARLANQVGCPLSAV
mmetsp:Transcript_10131/g.23683  ORF Transcript_10131/g.23683 Transcript_10131/m.23683 type:complete len:987 (+) Transcript_10131:176-3136(+)